MLVTILSVLWGGGGGVSAGSYHMEFSCSFNFPLILKMSESYKLNGGFCQVAQTTL